MKNNRPVLDLPFVSKLLEKVIHVHVQAIFDSKGLMPKLQSVYRCYHSSDEGFNDLLQAMNRGQMSALCLLDLTAAFDTVDPACCTASLDSSVGCDWFRCCVVLSDSLSSCAPSHNDQFWVRCVHRQPSMFANLEQCVLHVFADDT